MASPSPAPAPAPVPSGAVTNAHSPIHEATGAPARAGRSTTSASSVGPLEQGNSTNPAGEIATTFFQVPARGRRIVYVIDRSASMGLDGAFAVVKGELQSSLRQLPTDAQFQVIAYNRTAEPLSIRGHIGLAPATGQNTSAASAMVANLWPEGGTDHLAALKKALMLQPDVVYFLTDADGMSDQMIRAATFFNHGRAVIHAIQAARRAQTTMLPRLDLLAHENRGMHRTLVLDRY